ncbi:hypothetical protein CMI37_21915 [Candidatus Pacearchaeota archaeon]|nr:hypothetical protein [Candidatus Pacearchaeota archaeon]|tara:strand:+ start:146 stop:421 length:276 start_codon:yes stop_codon:yes gene_type:complete
MSEFNPFERFEGAGTEIVELTQEIHQILDAAIDENYFGAGELECIQGQMTDLIRQGVFWLQQENQQRFIYDLKNFLTWLVTFVETRQDEKG